MDRQGAAPATGAAPAQSSLLRCLTMMLDEVDYGMLLLDESGSVRLCNHVARFELDDRHPLQLVGNELRPRLRGDVTALEEAVEAAVQHGAHRLLILGEGDDRVSVAVRPLGTDVLDGGPATALVLGRRKVVENLSMQWFARARQLTPAETRVLEGLCAGVSPATIALRQGVRISTIRTQIGGIREKTGARSIRELVRLVAVLPPMVPTVPAMRENPAELLDEVMGSR